MDKAGANPRYKGGIKFFPEAGRLEFAIIIFIMPRKNDEKEKGA